MSRRFLLALAAAAAVPALVASPALAAGTGCHTAPPPPSAVNIYVEQTPSSGACTKKPVHHSKPSSVQPVVVRPSVTIPSTVTTKPKRTGAKHRKRHRKVTPKQLTKVAANVAPPSAVGAAFDLGSGPTALFAALLAAAALLAVGGGLHRGRRR